MSRVRGCSDVHDRLSLICFLPLFFLCYYLLPARFRNAFLLAGSHGFCLLAILPGLLAVDVAGEFLTNYSASERESFYFKTDFHWNPRGAFAASTDLAAAMQEKTGLRPQKPEIKETKAASGGEAQPEGVLPQRRTLPGRTLTVPIAAT